METFNNDIFRQHYFTQGFKEINTFRVNKEILEKCLVIIIDFSSNKMRHFFVNISPTILPD